MNDCKNVVAKNRKSKTFYKCSRPSESSTGSEIEQFFQNLERRETEPHHIEAIGNEANKLYQDTEESLNTEQKLRQQQSPLDEDLQQRLETQATETQILAAEALNAQQRYFKALQEWKRRETALLKDFNKRL